MCRRDAHTDKRSYYDNNDEMKKIFSYFSFFLKQFQLFLFYDALWFLCTISIALFLYSMTMKITETKSVFSPCLVWILFRLISLAKILSNKI